MAKILIVNDDELSLRVWNHAIKVVDIHCHVIFARNGREALELFNRLTASGTVSDDYPRLILLDLNMPMIDGWEVLKQYEEKYFQFFNDTKVIVTSSSISHHDVKRAKTYPFVLDFINEGIKIAYVRSLKEKNFF